MHTITNKLLFEIDAAIASNNLTIPDLIDKGKKSQTPILDITPNKDDSFSDMQKKVIAASIREFSAGNILNAISLLFIVTFINSFVMLFTFKVLYDSLGQYYSKEDLAFASMGLMAVFCAPITEEFYKRSTAKQNATAAGFIVFNVFETAQYIVQGATLLNRIGPLMMHATNTVIHKYGVMSDNIPTSTKNFYAKNSAWLPTVIHMCWNGMAIVSVYIAKHNVSGNDIKQTIKDLQHNIMSELR